MRLDHAGNKPVAMPRGLVFVFVPATESPIVLTETVAAIGARGPAIVDPEENADDDTENCRCND